MAEQPRYKSPVFAVFPFEQPGVFSYAVPDLQGADPVLMKTIRTLEDAQKEGISIKRRVKKRSKSVKKENRKK
ncbi:hypothetical protein SS50377_28700 [Spironucleus salmonicida]|uniref:Uncharacterized protein n=1 Tax=Spironucleus salmonicida TaxID=348837 RepID=V6LS07_9EUKA|nr:hypothetical protein SS50377_28700 [Spironucleus salmonicida]|eukprot:EST47043.1 hypothetical protein SS50377_12908 [Spironucleus salmonicida]